MATYKKNEGELITTYTVEIDYYLDETVFNGEYLKNEDGQLVYFGLKNVDGDYLNKLSDVDLTNCITSSDDNYTIKLEKVDNTAAKIFVNKPKKKLTLDKRDAYCYFYYTNILGWNTRLFSISYYPEECHYSRIYNIHQIYKISTPTFSFNNLYYVINYNCTSGIIDIDELKTASTIDITSNDLDKTFLHDDNFHYALPPNINNLIYTYYSDDHYYWYLYESGYTPIDLLSKHYDRIFSAKTDFFTGRGSFDYKMNRINCVFNSGDDGYIYFCAINHTNNTVVPVFKMYGSTVIERNKSVPEDTYTTYIIKDIM